MTLITCITLIEIGEVAAMCYYFSFNIRTFYKYCFIFRINFEFVDLLSSNSKLVGRKGDTPMCNREVQSLYNSALIIFDITDDYYFCKFARVNLSYLGSEAIYRRDVVCTAQFRRANRFDVLRLHRRRLTRDPTR